MSSKKCNPPEGIENGTIAYINNDSSNTLLGDMITYTCLPGHDLKGDAERYCLRTGNWSGDDPFCIQCRLLCLTNANNHALMCSMGVKSIF